MDENVGYFQLVFETIITFFVLLIMTRLLGKKQLSHLTFFNYITGITIGSLAANMVILNTQDFLKELTTLNHFVSTFYTNCVYRYKIGESKSHFRWATDYFN